MSKTIDLQIDKSNFLIEGLRRNIGELSRHGISESDLTSMDNTLKQLSDVSSECDAIREELSKKIQCMKGKLAQVKEQYAEKKGVIKSNYPQEVWVKYGVMDKR